MNSYGLFDSLTSGGVICCGNGDTHEDIYDHERKFPQLSCPRVYKLRELWTAEIW